MSKWGKLWRIISSIISQHVDSFVFNISMICFVNCSGTCGWNDEIKPASQDNEFVSIIHLCCLLSVVLNCRIYDFMMNIRSFIVFTELQTHPYFPVFHQNCTQIWKIWRAPKKIRFSIESLNFERWALISKNPEWCSLPAPRYAKSTPSYVCSYVCTC
jgi:hypothetical protein